MPICLLTTHLQQTPLFRHTVEPCPENGLTAFSQVQIDKIMTIPRQKVGQVIGTLTEKQMSEISKLLVLWVGIADRGWTVRSTSTVKMILNNREM